MAKKAGLFRHVTWRLECLAYDLVSLLLRPFSFDQVSAFGASGCGYDRADDQQAENRETRP